MGATSRAAATATVDRMNMAKEYMKARIKYYSNSSSVVGDNPQRTKPGLQLINERRSVTAWDEEKSHKQ